VGPSIASASQVCSPICADLPIAPINSRKDIIFNKFISPKNKKNFISFI
jgi:hypothetical protein